MDQSKAGNRVVCMGQLKKAQQSTERDSSGLVSSPVGEDLAATGMEEVGCDRECRSLKTPCHLV